jgi:hypothetical protein
MFYYFLFPALYLYFVWRLVRGIRRRGEIRSEITWLTFLTAFLMIRFVFCCLVPTISRQAAAAVLVLALLGMIGLNLGLFRRYDRWIEAQEKKE